MVYFTQHLESMKDWPDKAIIMELTGITERNIDYAFNFVNIIVSRLMSSQTHSTYKLPMFYLVDSIMKNVGGPFAALFGKHFYDIFGVTISGLHDTDRKKLDFLIGTWEERKILPTDLLLLMRQTVQKPVIAAHVRVIVCHLQYVVLITPVSSLFVSNTGDPDGSSICS